MRFVHEPGTHEVVWTPENTDAAIKSTEAVTGDRVKEDKIAAYDTDTVRAIQDDYFKRIGEK